MEFVIDPPIATKIQKMKQRVRWQDSLLTQRQIDQTRLVLDDGQDDRPDFSFLVIGDSGSGPHRGHNPQRRVAEFMLSHRDACRFILHTGDVIYLTGSSEFYPKNFIEPYREFLVGGDRPRRIAYNQMVFNLPFLPVLGNHDYYDLPLVYSMIAQMTQPLRHLLESRLDFDVGWRGSEQGNAYAKAFLDYLMGLSQTELQQHLNQHYGAQTDTGYALNYQPGQFTRLPNRYYSFRVGGIDFFALDSNTFNAPAPLPNTPEGDVRRRRLEAERSKIDSERMQLLDSASKYNSKNPEDAERLDDMKAKLEQLGEVKKDIDKQLATDETTVTDLEQLEWLQQRLIQSWNTESVRGRVLFFHHPPYVTEATKWHQAQTLAVRDRLRYVLDRVAKEIGPRPQPIVDLVLNGHAHCLEYLRTLDTGHADANTNWIVCGGSGYSLRRQRQEGPELAEPSDRLQPDRARAVAKSLLFVGRNGQGVHKRRPYSFLRIDVKAGSPPKFVVRPFISERYHRQWSDRALEPFEI
ncbi:metallophosphoesterase [Leptolyngbya sp. FACHB-36]|uniref:metallophosphoesterase family protein n=1 Tax=Leptolyngbya sp. FACHB-36 TaxID=2692808 RepID=UPI001681952E|nr:metallophosphoesterase [Leptolyngbya sp. FACHB-36]MBD2020069.1 metallophosphoesterase [Leptolyngbya sp. FACHB-36]